MYHSKVNPHKMTVKTTIAALIIIIPFMIFGQVKDQNLRLQVLKSNNVGHEFTFKMEDNSTIHLTYLGWLSSKKGFHYKIINSVWLWGNAHRATSRILIFDRNDKYLGNYPLTVIDDLPTYIKDNRLVFKNTRNGTGCDLQSITYLDFNNGIPNEFFRKCKGDKGDVYTFDKR